MTGNNEGPRSLPGLKWKPIDLSKPPIPERAPGRPQVHTPLDTEKLAKAQESTLEPLRPPPPGLGFVNGARPLLNSLDAMASGAVVAPTDPIKSNEVTRTTDPDNILTVVGARAGNIEAIPIGPGINGVRYGDIESIVTIMPHSDAVESDNTEDRASIVTYPDGSKTFIMGDGLSMSFYGAKGAQKVVESAQAICEASPEALFIDPKTAVQEISKSMTSYQAELERDVDVIMPPTQSTFWKDGARERLKTKGSSSTLSAIRVHPDGAVQYVTMGDAIVRIVHADGSVDQPVNTDSRKAAAPDGFFSTVGGVVGDQLVSERMQLNSGDRLLVGTDGLKQHLDTVLLHLQKGGSLRDIPTLRGEDDITLFAHEQK
jgi:hypothetical protein